MTLIVGLKCTDAIIMTAEEEEASGFASKRRVRKLKLFKGEEWALAFSGAGDAAIIDNAERQLSKWLGDQADFTSDQLANAIDDVLASIYTKYVDPDPKSEGISLMIGASCSDGLHLISTVKRTPHFQDSKTCLGYGADVAYYLLDRLYNDGDEWLNSVKIAAFATLESKESSQFCGGDIHVLVLQSPPNPRWRDLGDGGSGELESRLNGLLSSDFRKLLLDEFFDPKICEEYCDEQHPEPHKIDHKKLDKMFKELIKPSTPRKSKGRR